MLRRERDSSEQQINDRVQAGVAAFTSLCEDLSASTKEVAVAAQGLAGKEANLTSTAAVSNSRLLSSAAMYVPSQTANAGHKQATDFTGRAGRVPQRHHGLL